MITGAIVGGNEAVVRFDKFGSSIRDDLRTAVQILAIQLQAKVKEEKLSGQVLNVRTGRLRRSITQRVDADQARVYGIVGTNVEYGAAFEYGFSGVESVRAYMRQMKKAFGKTVNNPHEIAVSAHQRTVNIPEKSFLRSALAEMKDEITAAMAAAVKASAEKAFR